MYVFTKYTCVTIDNNITSVRNYSSQSQRCIYTVEVATGDRGDAGTDAKVSLSLCTDSKDCFLQVSNLAQYGSRGPSYDYFERGNHDIFEIPTTIECVDICRMIIGHDDSGHKSGWYLDYVKVEAYTDNGIKQSESQFPVYQWLATDESPYSLHAEVNHCPPVRVADHVAIA